VAKQILKRRIPVTAIHVDELEGVLKKLRVYDSVASGEARCHFCGEPISLGNIGGILSVNGETILICGKPECLIRAAILSAKMRAPGLKDEGA